MIRKFCYIAVVSAFLACAGLPAASQEKKGTPFKNIEMNFRQIPEEQKLAVYWYWMSDNISKEGVVNDLYAMKKAGINRAYIGNIGISDIPYGKVKLFSEEWWDILHTALKTATQLHIEIGIFNCPGWSQSGGPWIKPAQSMRYLASKSIVVKGPSNFKGKIPSIPNSTADVKVIAYPYIEAKDSFRVSRLPGDSSVIDFSAEKPQVVRSLVIETVHKPCRSSAELFVKEGKDYRSLAKFIVDRSNPSINVGFDPYAPVVVSLPETKGSEFRLLTDKGKGNTIAGVRLSDVPEVERYPEKTLAKMFQTPHPMWNAYLWRTQPEVTDPRVLVSPDKVSDITNDMGADGTLRWRVPEGKWVIMRTAMVSTGQTNAPAVPEGRGLEVDKMSEKHVAEHFNAFIGEILRRIPEQDRKTFHIVVEDSYETGGLNWTDSMIEDFTKKYAYSPVPYLPVFQGVVVGSEEQSDRFLWDVRRLVADKVAYDYVGGLRKISNENGLTTWLENYGHWGFPGEFLQYGGQSDEVAGEFWAEGDLGDIENKVASSCGHIYGKDKVWAESFTCGGPDFSHYPAQLKQRGDRFFTEGINSTLLHLYIEQPDSRVPGINAPFATEFNRHNTWFSQMDVFAQYLKRCNYMLQEGKYVADAAYFIGEDAPKMTGIRVPEIPRGYSYDYINAELLLDKDTKAENGSLSLKSGMQYKVLVLPPVGTMRPELLQKIKDLVAQGLTVLGPAPEKSPSLQNYPNADREVRALAKDLWPVSGEVYENFISYGKGRIYPNASLEEIFKNENIVPDFYPSDPCLQVLFIHRKLREGDLYFVSNQSDTTVEMNASFRVKGKIPELWNPQTAEIRRLPEYKEMTQATSVPMKLEAYESAFVVFRDTVAGNKENGNESKGYNYPPRKTLIGIDGPWTVAFQEKRGGPVREVLFKNLEDWTKDENDSIKYFSGTAVYRTVFKMKRLPREGRIYLDLGKLMVMAKVKLNGDYVGGVWTAPYRLNITSVLKKGKNDLEIEVVNNWRNRIIGDKNLPEKERLTWQTFSYLKKTDPLQSSGLLGPVEIQAYDYEMLP